MQLGEAYRRLGNLPKSLEALRRGSLAFEDLGVRRGRLQAHVRLSRALRDSGEIDGARLELRAAIALAEGQRTELALGSFRRSFLAESHGAYAELVDLLASSGDAAAAFEVFEAGRARSLLDSLETAAEPPGEEEELAARINALTERRLAAMQRGDGPLVEKLSAEVRRRRQALDRLELARLTDFDVKRASPLPRSFEDIQRTLPGDGTTIWAFSLGQDRSWLFRLDGVSIEALERAPRAEIETAAEAVHGLLRQTWSPEIAALADDAFVRLADLIFVDVELGD
ncbi:MAG: hypothetical protein AAFX50_25230, partial [Acidobacteriota bacterium]